MIFMKEYIIKQNKSVKQRTFRFVMHVNAVVSEMSYENTTEALIRQTWVGKNGENDVFEIVVLEYKETDSNDADQWERELNKIKDRLVFEVNEIIGIPVGILNREEIAEKWKIIRTAMLNDYEHADNLNCILMGTDSLLQDESQLLRATSVANEHIMLFPGIYGIYIKNAEKSIQARSLRSVLPGIHLPLKTVCRLENYNAATGACSLLIEGQTDYENFEKDRFRQTVKEITQAFNARTSIEVGYLEKYELDEHHWIDSAGRLYSYHVPGFMSNETICTLIKEN